MPHARQNQFLFECFDFPFWPEGNSWKFPFVRLTICYDSVHMGSPSTFLKHSFALSFFAYNSIHEKCHKNVYLHAFIRRPSIEGSLRHNERKSFFLSSLNLWMNRRNALAFAFLALVLKTFLSPLFVSHYCLSHVYLNTIFLCC